MAGYTKLFSSILASTIWREDNATRIVWITLLAMADKRGVAEGSIPGLADFARVSVEECEKALKKLSSPDKHSRSKISDGRRVEEVDGGWRLINHGKYREKMNADERREYLRVKQQEQREKRNRRASTRRQQSSTNVNTRSGSSTLSTHASPDADADASPDHKNPSYSVNTPKSVNPPLQSNGNGGVNARSRRPIFQGQRFVVFDWQLEDLSRLLGSHTEDFDLHRWFFDLDARTVKNCQVVPQRDGGVWLQAQTLAEASRRGLSIASSTMQQRLVPETPPADIQKLIDKTRAEDAAKRAAGYDI